MNPRKTYAGIGSRELAKLTYKSEQALLAAITQKLTNLGWVLRTGGAPGADTICQTAAETAGASVAAGTIELYLPWPKFNGQGLATLYRPQKEAYTTAAAIRSGFAYLKPATRALLARDSHQILGPDITHPLLSRFVLCWTPDGEVVGGTGQAIRLAKANQIPVYNLGDPAVSQRLQAWLTADLPLGKELQP